MMNKMGKMGLSFGMASLMLLQSTAGAIAAAPASPLMQDVKLLQSSIDSGKVSAADALDRFSQSIVEKNISVDQVNAFAKSQMTEKQYAAFQAKMKAALRGIDPAQLSSAELGQIVGQALADLRTEGLYWDGCAKAWTGAAIVAAAVIVAIIAVGKNKSDSQIQKDYQDQIASNQASATYEINSTNNWKTSFPQRIQSYQADIRSRQSDIDDLEDDRDRYTYLLAKATTQSDRDSYARKLSDIDDSIDSARRSINSDLSSISSLSNRMAVYASNPAQVAIDTQQIAANRDATTARLQAEEVSALAAAPGERDQARKMGIGAGIGAAIGAGILISNKQSGCFY